MCRKIIMQIWIRVGIFPGGGGGGGVLPCMYAYWVCAPRETPIFNPKFPFRSISFSQMKQYSAPEHHHFTFFAILETIIFTISSPPAVSLLQPARTQSVLQSVPETPTFMLELAPEPCIFTLELPAFSRLSSFRSPPCFTLPRHIPTKIWGEYPPPPPRAYFQLKVIFRQQCPLQFRAFVYYKLIWREFPRPIDQEICQY